MLCSSLVWGSDSAAWLTGGWHVQCSWDEGKTFVLTLWPPSLSQPSLRRHTLYVIFHFWLTRRWTDGGIAEDGGGWWIERGKARLFALSLEEGNKIKSGKELRDWAKGGHLYLNADVHARVRERVARRRRKGGRDGRRAPGRGCRQTGRVTRGRRWPSLLLEDRRLYLKAWSMLGAAEVSASQPGDSSPL